MVSHTEGAQLLKTVPLMDGTNQHFAASCGDNHTHPPPRWAPTRAGLTSTGEGVGRFRVCFVSFAKNARFNANCPLK